MQPLAPSGLSKQFAVKGGTKCYQTAFYYPPKEIYARSPKDLDLFRTSSHKYLSLNTSASITHPTLCPPRRVVILQRIRGTGLRRMINLDGLMDYMVRRGIPRKAISVRTLSESNTLKEQAKLIYETGLIITSHSSQIANLVFAVYSFKSFIVY
jgi:hypothetical protein